MENFDEFTKGSVDSEMESLSEGSGSRVTKDKSVKMREGKRDERKPGSKTRQGGRGGGQNFQRPRLQQFDGVVDADAEVRVILPTAVTNEGLRYKPLYTDSDAISYLENTSMDASLMSRIALASASSTARGGANVLYTASPSPKDSFFPYVTSNMLCEMFRLFDRIALGVSVPSEALNISPVHIYDCRFPTIGYMIWLSIAPKRITGLAQAAEPLPSLRGWRDINVSGFTGASSSTSLFGEEESVTVEEKETKAETDELVELPSKSETIAALEASANVLGQDIPVYSPSSKMLPGLKPIRILVGRKMMFLKDVYVTNKIPSGFKTDSASISGNVVFIPEQLSSFPLSNFSVKAEYMSEKAVSFYPSSDDASVEHKSDTPSVVSDRVGLVDTSGLYHYHPLVVKFLSVNRTTTERALVSIFTSFVTAS